MKFLANEVVQLRYLHFELNYCINNTHPQHNSHVKKLVMAILE